MSYHGNGVPYYTIILNVCDFFYNKNVSIFLVRNGGFKGCKY